jgi:hypothetical protein
MMDILGRAISEYFYGDKEYKLWVHDNHGPKVEMIVPIYFRSPEAMPDLELMAIDMCKGKTLDIGAGAGMKERGVKKAFVQDVFEMKQEKFDTLLLLMNGIGLVQTIEGLNRFLQEAKTMLKKGGQLLFDSSDVAYLYEEGLPQLPHYYGEVKCCYEYRRQKSEWFSWLYIDERTLRKVALDNGFDTKLLFVDESGQYLVKLTLSK